MSAKVKKCDVFVHTQMKRYVVGDMIEGTVTLIVYMPVTVDKILLKWKGANRKRLFGFTDNEKYKGKWGSLGCSQMHIVKVLTEIDGGRGHFNPGTYIFPFRFHTKANTPGSQPLKGNITLFSHYRTVYLLKAEVHCPDMPKVKHSQVVDMCEALKAPIEKAQNMQESSVSTWCCCGGGPVKTMVVLNKNAYSPGESIEASIFVDSTNCTVDLNSTAARLSYYIIAGKDMQKIEYGSIMRNFVASADGPTVKKGTKQTFKLTIPIPLDTNPDSNCNTEEIKKLGLEFQLALKGAFMRELMLSVPITIYALPVVNDPLPVTIVESQILPGTEITSEMFKPYGESKSPKK